MKTIIPFLLMALTITASSCKKEKGFVKVPIEINLSAPYATPEITTIDSVIELETFEFETNFDDVFKEQNSSKEKLEFALVDFMDLEIMYPLNENFNWMDFIEVYIMAEGLDNILGASLYEIPQNSRKISLNPNDKSLHEHLKKDNIKLLIKLKLNATLAKGILINIKTRYKGTAGIL